MVSELFEAFYILWDNLLGSDLRELLREYRRRQNSLLTSFGLLRPAGKTKVRFGPVFRNKQKMYKEQKSETSAQINGYN